VAAACGFALVHSIVEVKTDAKPPAAILMHP
jgi:hypothetical protein